MQGIQIFTPHRLTDEEKTSELIGDPILAYLNAIDLSTWIDTSNATSRSSYSGTTFNVTLHVPEVPSFAKWYLSILRSVLEKRRVSVNDPPDVVLLLT